MAREIRLPNKTQWALADIVARLLTANKRWERAMAHAERNLDPVMMQHLAHLRNDMAFVERMSKDALNGEYAQELQEELER